MVVYEVVEGHEDSGMFLLVEAGSLEVGIAGDCMVNMERHGGMVVVDEEEVHRVVPICMQSQFVAEHVGVAMVREVHFRWVSVDLETEDFGYHI